HLRFGGIQILWFAVAEDSSAEADHVAGPVEDRKHEPMPEPGARLDAAFSRDEQPGGELAIRLEAERRERIAYCFAIRRRVPDPEAIRIFAREAAGCEILASRLTIRRLP